MSGANGKNGKNGRRGSNGKGERYVWPDEEKTAPGVPPPGLVRQLTGPPDPSPADEESNRVADAVESLADAFHEFSGALHLVSRDIRRAAAVAPVTLQQRAAIGNAVRGALIQGETAVDEVIHPEGKRAAGGE